MIRPEELHLDGFGVPAQVADHVLQDLHELYPEAGESIVNLPAHGGDHLRAGSPGTILQPHGVVPAVRLGQKEAELRAGSPRERPHLGGAGEDGVHAREHAQGLVERRARGRPVVEDEGAFVHLRHEPRLDLPVGEPRDRQDRRAREQRDPGASEQPP